MTGRALSSLRRIVLLFACALMCVVALSSICSADKSKTGADLDESPKKAIGILQDQDKNALKKGTEITISRIQDKQVVDSYPSEIYDDKGHFKVTVPGEGIYRISVEGYEPVDRGLPDGSKHWSFDTRTLKRAAGKRTDKGSQGQNPGNPIQNHENASTVDIAHPGKFTVKGRLLDEQKHPVPDAQITAQPVTGQNVKDIAPVRTDDTGEFSIDLTERGKYQFSVEAEGFDATSWAEKITGSEQLNPPMLHKGGSVSSNPAPVPAGHTYDITLRAEGPTFSLGQMLWWAAAALLLATIALQIWSLTRTVRVGERLQVAVAQVRQSAHELQDAVINAESNRAREQRVASDTPRERDRAATASRSSRADDPPEPALRIGEQGYGSFPFEQDQRPAAAVNQEPVARAVPKTLEDEYEIARSSVDTDTAINEFKQRHGFVRLSLLNEEDVEINPALTPEFGEDSRGWFLGIGDDGQMRCLPYFKFDLQKQKKTFQKAFTFSGEGALRVTAAAILQRRGENWVLSQPGRIEAAV